MINNQIILFKFIQINDNANRYSISEYQKLSENFIREFKYKVDWVHISYQYILSENFIRKFKNKVDWVYIYQNTKH